MSKQLIITIDTRVNNWFSTTYHITGINIKAKIIIFSCHINHLYQVLNNRVDKLTFVGCCEHFSQRFIDTIVNKAINTLYIMYIYSCVKVKELKGLTIEALLYYTLIKNQRLNSYWKV